MGTTETKNLSEKNTKEVTEVLSRTFYDYPVMRYVLGDNYNYNERLYKLVGFFVAARVLRNEPMFGIYGEKNTLAAAAIVSLPGDTPAPNKLIEHRKKLWQQLGIEEQKRYENYGDVASSLMPKEPHHHLNMIGVIPEYKGNGLSRKLINEVEKLVTSHPESTGLSLNTESVSNVKLYTHFGFNEIGHARVDDNLETWAFFKPR
jgi:ribosomal protein S18 acetylase RimI-like enzyme